MADKLESCKCLNSGDKYVILESISVSIREKEDWVNNYNQMIVNQEKRDKPDKKFIEAISDAMDDVHETIEIREKLKETIINTPSC